MAGNLQVKTGVILTALKSLLSEYKRDKRSGAQRDITWGFPLHKGKSQEGYFFKCHVLPISSVCYYSSHFDDCSYAETFSYQMHFAASNAKAKSFFLAFRDRVIIDIMLKQSQWRSGNLQ